MAFEVRICARCGAEECLLINASNALFTIHPLDFDGARYEICDQCRNHIDGLIRSEMRYGETKPKSIIERKQDEQ